MTNYPDTLYVLRAEDSTGKVFWYTGKAGAAWLSQDHHEAWRFMSRSYADFLACLYSSRFELMSFTVEVAG